MKVRGKFEANGDEFMRRSIRGAKQLLTFTLAIFMAVALIGISLDVNAKKKSSESTYAAGDDIAFGYLDGTIINWTILKYDDTTKQALVVSRKTLSSSSVTAYRDAVNKQYYSTGTTAGYVQWVDNYWRGWLNQTFYNTAFTDTERAMIQQTALTAADNQKSLMNYYHDTTLDANYVASQVKNSLNMNIYNNQTTTNDFIFFLSTDEYTEFKDSMKFETYGVFPLRTNAYDDPSQGLFVNDSTKLIERHYYYLGTGIRPAMYIQLGEPEATTEDTSSDSTTKSASTSTSDSSTTTTSTDSSSDSSQTDTTTTETADTSSSSASTSSSSSSSSSNVTRQSYANNATNIGNINLPEDSSYSMSNGSTAQVALNMDYLNSTDKEYTCTYKSSDASVFTVDSNGLITATGAGTGTLTVRMKKSNGKVYTMTCRIDVT